MIESYSKMILVVPTFNEYQLYDLDHYDDSDGGVQGQGSPLFE